MFPLFRLVMGGSKYADRNVIGSEATIKGVTAEMVRAFYEK